MASCSSANMPKRSANDDSCREFEIEVHMPAAGPEMNLISIHRFDSGNKAVRQSRELFFIGV